ncbi:MerR family transcriptional regulator [Streptomyces sp. WMMC500]|uniref:MerR family transcriptional regulator n=1 Tax=Streptomyces sp. WMMC500 TaxID=3015154 RepID=UPI00248AE3F6|nr:MerR family transcriptional regulator [Streptomyces sp. WMMC500]WBB61383.1 MerR family transcriptional regulator [Streptomyces sp. WMMC500]
MTQETEAAGLTVDELAARAGVTVRTVRFYSTRGLLPPPVIGPRRVGRYGPEHLSRLALIEELQHQGLTLAAIERYVQQLPTGLSAEDHALHRALVATWVPDAETEVSRAELERRAGRSLTDDDVARLAAMGVLERTPGAAGASGPDPAADGGGNGSSDGDADGGDAFRVDPAVLHLGVRLLDVPIRLETLLAARGVVQEHSRAVARELTRLFHDEVWEPFGEADPDPEQVETMKSLSAHMQPMVVQALVTAFQRSMKAELRASFPAE